MKWCSWVCQTKVPTQKNYGLLPVGCSRVPVDVPGTRGCDEPAQQQLSMLGTIQIFVTLSILIPGCHVNVWMDAGHDDVGTLTEELLTANAVD